MHLADFFEVDMYYLEGDDKFIHLFKKPFQSLGLYGFLLSCNSLRGLIFSAKNFFQIKLDLHILYYSLKMQYKFLTFFSSDRDSVKVEK